MLVKSQVKYIQSLGQKKFRDQEGAFIVEGPKMVKELLSAPNTRPLFIYGVKEWLEGSREWLPATAASCIIELKEGELERISSLATPNQVLAVLERPSFPSPVFNNTVSLLLDGIQDPGNLGTIVRIADWFGLRQIVCSRDCADIFNSKAVQSTMGSITRVQVLYDDPEEVIRLHPTLPVFAAVLEGQPIYETGHVPEGLLMIGNESRGIRPELLEKATHRITIPRRGQAESLNAAVATGIILSHLV